MKFGVASLPAIRRTRTTFGANHLSGGSRTSNGDLRQTLKLAHLVRGGQLHFGAPMATERQTDGTIICTSARRRHRSGSATPAFAANDETKPPPIITPPSSRRRDDPTTPVPDHPKDLKFPEAKEQRRRRYWATLYSLALWCSTKMWSSSRSKTGVASWNFWST